MSDKKYDKMNDYIESLFNVFQLVNRKAETQKDRRLKMISLVIFNYIRKMAKDNDIGLTHLKEPVNINLIPIFEYISFNNIELFDFDNIDINQVDTTKNEDLERFVLTHVYYITQPKNKL
jgi:hypothetical protein